MTRPVFSPTPGRSRNMAAIRSRNTRPELALREALRNEGLRGYRCHHAGLPGKPDIAFTRWRVAVFIDGAFWHGHPDHFTFGKNGDYWDEKVNRTQRRDRDQQAALEATGYTVIRFWDFDVKADVDGCVAAVKSALDMARHRMSR
jgi:DNA mismatch endonuclease (patch repair protein)